MLKCAVRIPCALQHWMEGGGETGDGDAAQKHVMATVDVDGWSVEGDGYWGIKQNHLFATWMGVFFADPGHLFGDAFRTLNRNFVGF